MAGDLVRKAAEQGNAASDGRADNEDDVEWPDATARPSPPMKRTAIFPCEFDGIDVDDHEDTAIARVASRAEIR